MKIKQKRHIYSKAIGAALFVMVSMLTLSGAVGQSNVYASAGDNGSTKSGKEVVACDTETSIIQVDCDLDNDGKEDPDANPIWGLLLLAINILTAGIGIVAVGGIVYAAILWTTAEDKNAQIVKSKETIFNVVVGLVAFALLYAFLQFLIPGGVFNK